MIPAKDEGIQHEHALDTIPRAGRTKRKSAGSKVMCACRKVSGCAEECIVPGEEHHWMHEGNDEADRLAKQSKDMGAVCGMAELLKGKEAYVLGNSGGIAQGDTWSG